jgi:hypothetical protein
MATIKDLPKPVWTALQDGWLAHIPQDLVGNSPNVEKLLRLNNVVELGDKVEVDLVPGIRERTFSDALLLRQKSIYCFNASRQLSNSGFSTLTALTMYDASFFSAKSFVYLLGIRDASRSSKAYLSLFHSYKLKKVEFDGHYSVKLPERMTHDSLWNVFTRLINTFTCDDTTVFPVKNLRGNDYTSFSRERNFVAYEPAGWSRHSTPEPSDLFYAQTYLDNHKYYEDHGATEAEYVDKYYRTAHTLINFIDMFLSAIGKFAPSVAMHLQQHPGLYPVRNMRFS